MEAEDNASGPTVVIKLDILLISSAKEIIVLCLSKVICSSDVRTAQALAVVNELDITKCSSNAAVPIHRERIKLNADLAVATGVDGARVNQVTGGIHNLGCSLVVAVDKEGIFVRVVIALYIAISERELECALVRTLASKLRDAVCDRLINCLVDEIQGLLIILRNDDRHGVFRIAPVHRDRLRHMCVGRRTSFVTTLVPLISFAMIYIPFFNR